ncbi:hypothetical protein Hanom_Chr07g00626431 [Helianthus anomalus]
MYYFFKEAKHAKRWDDERKCYLGPQGNPSTHPKTIDFAALLATIPTAAEYYAKKKKDKELAKKREEETIDENQEKMDEN